MRAGSRPAVRSRVAAVLLVAATTVFPRAATAQEAAYIGGVEYAAGRFVFARRTWSAYLSNGIAWTQGRLRASTSIPLVWQPGDWVQYSGSGMMVPTGGAGSRGSTTGGSMMGGTIYGGTMTPSSSMTGAHVGIGDPVARIDVALVERDSRAMRVGIVGAAKAPLSDAGHGFGTGEWDAGAGLSAGGVVAGITLFADAVYWRIGNPPGASFRNAVAYSLWAGRPVANARWSVLATISGATSLWAGLGAPARAGAGIGYLSPSGVGVFGTAAAGLTRTSPALSAALGWRVPLGQAR